MNNMNMNNNDTPIFFHCLSYNTLFAHEHLYKDTPVSNAASKQNMEGR